MNKKIIFYIYTIILIFFVLFKFSFTINDLKDTIEQFREVEYQRVNLDFLNTIKMQVSILDRWAIINLLGNTIPFVIFGLLFYISFKCKIINLFLYSLIFIISLELIQLIFVIGTFDIDDIFLNSLSILIGLVFGKYALNNKHFFPTID